jgi:hypothetical protein
MTGTVTEIVVQLPRLHVGQVRRRALVTSAQARFVVTMCGRRWGKSIDGEEWVEDGAIDGMHCGWFTPTYKYLIEVWDSMVHRLAPITLRSDKTEKRIELRGGGLIECWTMDTPDPGRSRKYHRIVVDEAGITRNLSTIWTQSLRPTLTDYAGHAWFYGTPKGRTHDFTQLFAKGESGDVGWLSHRAPTRENPFIPAEEIEAARRDMPEGAFLQEYEGIPADDAANPFGQSAIMACLGALSSEPPVVWGWDFARAQDWTVGIALDEAGNVCRLERWQHTPWGETKQAVVKATAKVVAIGDSTGIGDAIVEDLQRLGTPIEGYMFTPKSKQQLMERLAGAIQARELTFPDGVIRSELETFGYEYTAHGVRYEAPAGLHDDAVMALALALYGYDTYGFGLAYQRKLHTPGVRVEREGVTLGLDWKNQKPHERPTPEQEFARMMGLGPSPSPLAGRANQRLPRR